MNLFGTILTYSAPSANYRGEGAENRAVIQKITKGRFEYAIISPEAVRNALRETLRAMGLPCNRQRLHDEEQLAVKFEDYPDADRYADDFFMGWLLAKTGNDRKKILKEIEEKGRDPEKFTFKRDSILRMNMAVALTPYRHDSVFTQSPYVINEWRSAPSSMLLHRDTTFTEFQYPFALNLNDCKAKPEWTKILLKAIGQLNNVSGNHARSYFEFTPASILLRLTDHLVAGYNSYGFSVDEKGKHYHEIIDTIRNDEFPGNEFYLGGKILKDLEKEIFDELKIKGVTLEPNPQKLLELVGEKAFPTT